MCTWGLNEWGDIANIVIAVASVATAIATKKALHRQNNLQEESLLVQQSAQQPIFNVFYELVDSDNDGKYENEVLNISNDGGLLIQIKKISVTTIFDVVTNHQHSLLKINGYFFRNTNFHNLRGLIYKSRGNNNNGKFYDIYNTVIKNSKIGELFYELYRYNLIKIEYIDIRNTDKVCYYKDRINIDEYTYNDLMTQVINKQDILDIDKISFEDIFINEIK